MSYSPGGVLVLAVLPEPGRGSSRRTARPGRGRLAVLPEPGESRSSGQAAEVASTRVAQALAWRNCNAVAYVGSSGSFSRKARGTWLPRAAGGGSVGQVGG